MSEERDNSGVLFKNDKHVEGDRQPNYRGPAIIGGVKYEVSLWRKESKKLGKDGKPIVFLSTAYKVVDEMDQQRGQDL
jgi:hypothetical protein